MVVRVSVSHPVGQAHSQEFVMRVLMQESAPSGRWGSASKAAGGKGVWRRSPQRSAIFQKE